MSSFEGLNVALTSLWAQRQGLDVTGQNIANVNTDGYTRQRVDLESIGAPTVPTMYSSMLTSGAGVKVTDLERVRDAFLATRSLQEHATGSSLNQTQSVLSDIELSFSEPGDNGLQAQMAAFWNAWSDVANRPSDIGARAQLVEQAQTVASGFNQVATALTSLRASSTAQVENLMAEVNSAGAQIGQLNNAIQNAINSGLGANELLDQRDQLVARLADLVGVTTRPGVAGSVDVLLGGSTLVSGSTSHSLSVVTAPDGSLSVNWSESGAPADVSGGGSVGGLVDAVNNVIPKYQSGLDDVARQLATLVNAQQGKGVDAYGNPGGTFFSGSGAANLALSASLAADPQLVAAAAAGAGPLDGSNALVLGEFGLVQIPDPTSTTDPPAMIASPDAVYRGLVTNLGVESQRANRRADMQSEITTHVDSASKSVSTVSLDEEMTNMLAFQHAYDAAAKFMSTVDKTIETLLGMGAG